jgi:hypothetical protein
MKGKGKKGIVEGRERKARVRKAGYGSQGKVREKEE